MKLVIENIHNLFLIATFGWNMTKINRAIRITITRDEEKGQDILLFADYTHVFSASVDYSFWPCPRAWQLVTVSSLSCCVSPHTGSQGPGTSRQLAAKYMPTAWWPKCNPIILLDCLVSVSVSRGRFTSSTFEGNVPRDRKINGRLPSNKCKKLSVTWHRVVFVTHSSLLSMLSGTMVLDILTGWTWWTGNGILILIPSYQDCENIDSVCFGINSVFVGILQVAVRITYCWDVSDLSIWKANITKSKIDI